MDGIEKELNCVGYFGFGGGVSAARHGPELGGEIYCNRCPLAGKCWNGHRERVRSILPDVMAEFEEMAKMIKGPDLIQAWWERHKTGDPLIGALGANMEDGMRVGEGGQPKDRGPLSIAYPFVEH